jgi:hypothetical protein
VQWFLRSMADRDTHKGRFSTVTRSMRAVCGIEWVPRRFGLRERLALPGEPPDSEQIYLICSRREVRATLARAPY